MAYHRNDSMLFTKEYLSRNRFVRIIIKAPTAKEPWLTRTLVILTIFSTGIAVLSLWIQAQDITLDKLLQLRQVRLSYWLPTEQLTIRFALPSELGGGEESLGILELVNKYARLIEKMLSKCFGKTKAEIASTYPVIFIRQMGKARDRSELRTLVRDQLSSLLFDTYSWKYLSDQVSDIPDISPFVLLNRFVTDVCTLELFTQQGENELAMYAAKDHLDVEEEFMGQESSTVIILEILRMLLTTLAVIDSILDQKKSTNIDDIARLKMRIFYLLNEYNAVTIASRHLEYNFFLYGKRVMNFEGLYSQVMTKIDILERLAQTSYQRRHDRRMIALEILAIGVATSVVIGPLFESMFKLTVAQKIVLTFEPLLIALFIILLLQDNNFE